MLADLIALILINGVNGNQLSLNAVKTCTGRENQNSSSQYISPLVNGHIYNGKRGTYVAFRHRLRYLADHVTNQGSHTHLYALLRIIPRKLVYTPLETVYEI